MHVRAAVRRGLQLVVCLCLVPFCGLHTTSAFVDPALCSALLTFVQSA